MLHHLAQVATASKPPRLDEAEGLLQVDLSSPAQYRYRMNRYRNSF